jgi:uncharacterized protein YdhG (YjbR/CyaY superfamily)
MVAAGRPRREAAARNLAPDHLAGHDGGVDEQVQRYIDEIAPANRPLFDRLHRLILAAYPDATVGISYRIPTYRVGGRRLYVGAWRPGLSVYGWPQGQDGGFADRHPALRTSKGTIRLRPQDAAGIPDEDLRDLVRAALER